MSLKRHLTVILYNLSLLSVRKPQPVGQTFSVAAFCTAYGLRMFFHVFKVWQNKHTHTKDEYVAATLRGSQSQKYLLSAHLLSLLNSISQKEFNMSPSSMFIFVMRTAPFSSTLSSITCYPQHFLFFLSYSGKKQFYSVQNVSPTSGKCTEYNFNFSWLL